MNVVVGLLLGTGLLLVLWWYAVPPAPRRVRVGRGPSALLERAGLSGVTPRVLVASCVGCFVTAAVVMLVVSGVATIAFTFGVMGALLPVGILRGRAQRRLREHAELWPDAVDNLASAVRAGLSLPEALAQLGERGSEGLREPFTAFGRDYQATGRFNDALELLKRRLADPTGDRVVEALRVARDVGGGDLGRMLRSLSAFLRDDLRTRSELEARQSWTVNAARLAVAAPWVVLLAMSLQRDVVSRYASGTGAVVLGVGAVVCLIAYRLMMWLGRLPTERRVLA
ncbi:type II secretion system F family protein [Aeromicrobium sp. CTD01-1L150]|uniref:type II secretion system F family protein n=1 Tax=Aeromicrobium sp. CTD01-1L150 TaxID=3341830 RepID=UPI0035C0D4C2